MKNHVALRLFLAANILITASGLASRIEGALPVALLLYAIAALAVLDTVINDVLPEKFSWQATENARHWLYLAVAALCTASALAIALRDAPSWTMARLVLDATLACYIAVKDVVARYINPRKERAAE